jgi:hypothetical protein
MRRPSPRPPPRSAGPSGGAAPSRRKRAGDAPRCREVAPEPAQAPVGSRPARRRPPGRARPARARPIPTCYREPRASGWHTTAVAPVRSTSRRPPSPERPGWSWLPGPIRSSTTSKRPTPSSLDRRSPRPGPVTQPSPIVRPESVRSQTLPTTIVKSPFPYARLGEGFVKDCQRYGISLTGRFGLSPNE